MKSFPLIDSLSLSTIEPPSGGNERGENNKISSQRYKKWEINHI